MMAANRVQWPAKCDEVAGDEARPLVDQLVERVLAVGSRLPEVDGARVTRYATSVEHNLFSVALHGQLLQVGWKTLKVLLVRQHCNCLGAEEIVVPDRKQAHKHGQVAIERSRAEMFIHLVAAV